jgi:hypothetical protein
VRSVAVTLLVLGLLGGATAAFAITEALKLERSPITAPDFTKRFSPTCRCPEQRATLAFRLRTADRLDAAVVNGDADVVRTLVGGKEHKRGRVQFEWDGRDDAGRVVPDGRYRLRVRLAREHRTILMPNPVVVDTRPPHVRILGLDKPAFSPDGDGRDDSVTVRFQTSEAARPVLLVDGTVAEQGRHRFVGRAGLEWDGKVQGRALPVGTYELALWGRDRAGNLSRRTESVSVRLRFVGLDASRYTAVRRTVLRFRVDADATSVSWQLARKGGRVILSASAVRPGEIVVRLPARLRAGAYVLKVSAASHSDRARVRITRSAR